MDTDYRKSWDDLVIKLEVVDREEPAATKRTNAAFYDSKNEVIHWVMHYPVRPTLSCPNPHALALPQFPLYGRDYCYVRRAIVDNASNLMVLVSRAVDHPKCPETNKYVRVQKYESNMVIKPHTTFDANGFDYLLTYHDDPKV